MVQVHCVSISKTLGVKSEMKLSTKRIVLLALSLLMISSLIYYGVTFFNYELTITRKANGVELHTLQLGEYFSPVQELHILDEQRNIVVLFMAKSENSAMHTVTINAGVNRFNDMYLENYDISYPSKKAYTFLKEERYEAVVKWPRSVVRDSFVIR